MQFSVEGPFDISRHGSKNLIDTKKSLNDLKVELGNYDKDLLTACGCYVFATRAGAGYKPHYVGQALKTVLWKEALNPSNTGKYNKALNGPSGAPVIFLIPLLTKSGNYKKTSKSVKKNESLNFLETWLIQTALDKNPELLNIKQTRFPRGLYVNGIFNAGKGDTTKASLQLTKALW